ncbi:branched-chain amino acid ABC transporter permease [Variovorax sp. Sphag1AA]|uniref:branched-chain amino acid ABC transporter permease n=1 Tax=Variovorax sp. Sphag1AA TaxID=2587027 RepID=UPI00161837B2|nr:branched-chain amino acid ABC transporter permease [Variovorax sp. Sphag1AA]MBB3182097.1 branched-chain amino acid transport system permease protein [Variovorax sp. Sphag1AA]
MTEALLQQLLNGLSIGFGYALIALGLTLAFGVLHIINFGHGEVVMLGALTVVLANKLLGLPYLAALPLAMLVGAIVGWVFDWLAVSPLLRRADGRTDILLTTFAVGVLFNQAVLSVWGPAPARVDGLQGRIELAGVGLSAQRLFVIVASIVALVVLDLLARRTRFGVEMRALAQSEHAARVVGINVKSVGTRAFLLAAVVGGLGGALLAPITSYSPMLGQAVLIKAFVIVVLGGLGSAGGAVLCALAVGVIEAMLGLVMEEGMAAATVYSLMLVVLLVRPQGLAGAAR